jgi:hypothetical protein
LILASSSNTSYPGALIVQKLHHYLIKRYVRDLKLFVNVVTLSETLYIASRIYQAAGSENPNMEALYFVEWIKGRA